MPPLLIDPHCHLLPGIDDGSRNMETTLALLRKEQEDGVQAVVFTPHFYYERMTLESFAANRQAAYRATAAACKQAGLRVAGRLGAEVYFSPGLLSLDLRQLAFAGTNYLLVELPTTFQPGGIGEVLFAIQQRGFTPVLAHVERYPYVTEDPTLLYQWVSAGALAQINASSLIRSGQTAKMLQKYIRWNLVHLLASDAHSVDHRPPNLKDGYKTLPPQAARRFMKNGEQVFWGNPLVPPEPVEPQYRFGQWN